MLSEHLAQSEGTALSVSTVTADNISIAAAGSAGNYQYTDGSVSCARSGYTPLGIVGFQINNATSSGTGSPAPFLAISDISGTTLSYRLTNYRTAAIKVKVIFSVLYKKD